MILYTVECDYLCMCGMHHVGRFTFSSVKRLAHWLIVENTNIDKVYYVKETAI